MLPAMPLETGVLPESRSKRLDLHVLGSYPRRVSPNLCVVVVVKSSAAS